MIARALIQKLLRGRKHPPATVELGPVLDPYLIQHGSAIFPANGTNPGYWQPKHLRHAAHLPPVQTHHCLCLWRVWREHGLSEKPDRQRAGRWHESSVLRGIFII